VNSSSQFPLLSFEVTEMSETFEQQIGQTFKADTQAIGNFFSEAYKDSAGTLNRIEANATRMAAQAHLPGLDLFDSSHQGAKVGARAGSDIAASHTSADKETVALTEKLQKAAQVYKTDDAGHAPNSGTHRLESNPGRGPSTGTEAPVEPKAKAK
jgi:hypothetical protein